MTDSVFTHDVLPSHGAKDKVVVRAVTERLRQDGRKPNEIRKYVSEATEELISRPGGLFAQTIVPRNS